MKNEIKIIRNERGAALIAMLMFLVVLTVIGLTSISITSLENKTAKNERVREERYNCGEAGIDPQVIVLEETINNSGIPAAYTASGGPVISGSNLEDEIVAKAAGADSVGGAGAAGPDLQITCGTATVNMDIDYLLTRVKSGASIEFANANSGVGAGAGSGGTERFFQFISRVTIQNATGDITNVYDCVVTDGCQK